MGPLAPLQFAAGAVVCIVLSLASACTSSGQLTPLMQCKLDALKVLPADPMMATVYDAVDVIARVRACHRKDSDGGVS